MDFRDPSFMEQLKGNIRIWTESTMESVLMAISHYHSLFLFICPKECRTAIVTMIPGLEKLQKKVIESTNIQNYQ